MDGRMSGRPWQRIRRHVLPRGSVCALCGAAIDPDIPWPDPWSGTVDHKIPKAHGGPDTYSNLQPAHFRCNRLKSDGAEKTVRRSGSLG